MTLRWEPDGSSRGEVALLQRSVRGIEGADSHAIVAALKGSLRWDLAALLARVAVPILVVAAHDAPGSFPVQPGSALRGSDRDAVRAALAPERVVVLDGGHCLHRDDPARWLEAVEGFAREVLG